MLQIQISGGINQGPSWVDLQRLISGMLDTPGKLTRIARLDGGVNYRQSYGVYELTFTPDTGDAIEIELRINR